MSYVNHLAAAVITVNADMMAAVQFTCGGVTRQGRTLESVVGTAHSALGRSFTILLYGHGRIGLENPPIVAEFSANASLSGWPPQSRRLAASNASRKPAKGRCVSSLDSAAKAARSSDAAHS